MEASKQVSRNAWTQPCEPFGRLPRLYVGAVAFAKTVQMPNDSCRPAQERVNNT